MGVIRRRNENNVKILGVFLKDFTPVRVRGGVLPTVPAVNLAPGILIYIGKCDTLQTGLIRCIGMGPGPSAHGNKAHLKFFIESAGPKETGETNGASRSNSSGTFDKLTPG